MKGDIRSCPGPYPTTASPEFHVSFRLGRELFNLSSDLNCQLVAVGYYFCLFEIQFACYSWSVLLSRFEIHLVFLITIVNTCANSQSSSKITKKCLY